MKFWNFIGHYIPNNVVVCPEIVVYKLVSHPCNRSPFEIRIFVSDLSGKFLHCFTNDLDASDKSPFEGFVFSEFFFVQIFRSIQQVFGLIQNVTR